MWRWRRNDPDAHDNWGWTKDKLSGMNVEGEKVILFSWWKRPLRYDLAYSKEVHCVKKVLHKNRNSTTSPVETRHNIGMMSVVLLFGSHAFDNNKEITYNFHISSFVSRSALKVALRRPMSKLRRTVTERRKSTWLILKGDCGELRNDSTVYIRYTTRNFNSWLYSVSGLICRKKIMFRSLSEMQIRTMIPQRLQH